MVKKIGYKKTVKASAIFQTSTWSKKNKIIPPVTIGASFQNSTKLKKRDYTFRKNEIIPSDYTFIWCYILKHNMVKQMRLYLQ